VLVVRDPPGCAEESHGAQQGICVAVLRFIDKHRNSLHRFVRREVLYLIDDSLTLLVMPSALRRTDEHVCPAFVAYSQAASNLHY
jgi:hypothetical protein